MAEVVLNGPSVVDLHRTTPWLWLNCEHCQHHAPLACAVAVIRYSASGLGRRRYRLFAVPGT
jgi:hypothetical protein